jgi:branched-chain amino acid transport system permease protein
VLQQLVNGLTLGVVYALIGMGFSMVWATARTMNFAYGATYTLGAYLLYVVLTRWLGTSSFSIAPLLLAFLVTGVVGVALGYGMDRAIFRPLRENELAPFFASLGVAIALENLFTVVFGGRPSTVTASASTAFYDIGSVRVTTAQLVVLGASLVLMAALQAVVSRTSLGRAMRATAWSRSTARLMGIDPDRIIAIVFIVATVLALWAGLFVALFYGTVTPYMGSEVLIKGLAAAILGGFGYLPGAIAGGLLVGLLEAGGAQLTTSGNWPDVMAYGVLILLILFRPQGMFSGKGVVA